jgi:hypothetical protein
MGQGKRIKISHKLEGMMPFMAKNARAKLFAANL